MHHNPIGLSMLTHSFQKKLEAVTPLRFSRYNTKICGCNKNFVYNLSMALSFNVLKYPDFRLLLCTRLFGGTAMQAQAVIVGWQIYSITKSPFMLGLSGLFEAIPALACALFAGHVVDSFRPHRVFHICIGLLALNMLMLFLIGGKIIPFEDGTIVYWLFAGVFVSGLLRSFLMPASFVLQPQIIPRNENSAASAWLTGTFQTAIISGPAIAGIIYGGYGATTAWTIPVSLMAIEFLVIAMMSKKIKNYKAAEKREPAVQSIKAGWKFILTNKILLSVMALDMFAVLFGGAVSMLPAFADQVLHVGSEGLGILRASPAIGAILVALYLATNPLKTIKATTLLWVVAGFGICIIGFGLSQYFWLSLVFLAISGAFDSVSMIIRSTLMQLLTPDAMRGRVSSVNSMFIISSNEIGSFESGTAARFLGLVPSVVFGGICTITIVALTALCVPKFRRTVVNENHEVTQV